MNKELVFRFKDDDVKRVIESEVSLLRRMNKSFDYIYDKLKELNFHMVATDGIPVIPDNENYTESGLFKEGKSYHWTSIDCGDIRILIRKYRNHFTVFTRYEKNDEYKDIQYCGFELHTDTSIEYALHEQGKSELYKENWEEYGEDFFYCHPFHDFNLLIKNIVEMIRNDRFWLLWNDVSLPKPERVKIKQYFHGRESIDSLDKTIYAGEELSNIHCELFAENDMVDKIKTMKVGDKIGDKVITKIKTQLKDKYDNYHSIGLEWDENRDKKKWNDVYSLTHWHIDEIFNIKHPEFTRNELDAIANYYTNVASKMIKKGKSIKEVKEYMEDCPESLSKYFLLNSLEEKKKKK